MACRKCGRGTMMGPKYRSMSMKDLRDYGFAGSRDCLVYTCSSCGYEEETETQEQKQKKSLLEELNQPKEDEI